MKPTAGRTASMVLATVALMAAAGTGTVLLGCGRGPADPLAEARKRFAAALRDSGLVTDPKLVSALENVPLHELAQPPAGPEAYGELPAVRGAGGAIGVPVVDVVMVEAAKVKRGNKVLDVAPGIGYRAAVCTKLGAQVCCVVGNPDQQQALKEGLKRIGCGSVIVELGIKAQGCPKYGPFNVLFADWDASSVPEAILDQVRNQGRVVLRPRVRGGRILVLKCQKTTLSPLQVFDVSAILQSYRAAWLSAGR